MPSSSATDVAPWMRSKLSAVLIVGGILLPILSGGLLALHYVGHPQVQDSVPTLAYILLPLGLLSAGLGKRLYEGKWDRLIEGLHINLAFAGLAYAGRATMYVLSGKSIRPYPAGLLLAISAILMVSRFVSRIVVGRKHR